MVIGEKNWEKWSKETDAANMQKKNSVYNVFLVM